MRWLYHVAHRDRSRARPYAPESLVREGFVHASYLPLVAESARIYFDACADLVVLQIDPRRLEVPLVVADTPRGPMPHILGSVVAEAIIAEWELRDLATAPDWMLDSTIEHGGTA